MLVKLLIFCLIINKIITESECLSVNKGENINLNDCTNKEISYSNDTYVVKCCLLSISERSIRKCIVQKDDEDEIENRINAFKVMFEKPNEVLDISIDCSNDYFKLNILFFIFIFLFLL